MGMTFTQFMWHQRYYIELNDHEYNLSIHTGMIISWTLGVCQQIGAWVGITPTEVARESYKTIQIATISNGDVGPIPLSDMAHHCRYLMKRLATETPLLLRQTKFFFMTEPAIRVARRVAN